MFTIGWIEKPVLAMYVLCIVEYSVLVNQEASSMFANWSQAGPYEVEGKYVLVTNSNSTKRRISLFNGIASSFVP